MNEKQKPKKQRSDGEQSRERLLAAAMRLFAEQGYARASTREIALAAGANVAAISYYFGDKAGLYRATFRDFTPSPEENIARYEQPHFTLRQSLEGFFGQMLEPFLQGEKAELCSRLWFREMLEPTGVWESEIENGIRPEHQALSRVLARHLGLARPDDETHRLALSVGSLALLLMMSSDVVAKLQPQLLEGADAIPQWIRRLSDYAEAMVASEKTRIEGCAHE
ncbi:CerR family C-terminal domain-containing protein [Pseudoduganella namucuonensis]|uniref:Transcriptional regulator, TetR family n=1 Tax=Pseudoduganella namucuonensis TaxID=1035707 RepID=A0A1I7FM70_9BURK|nr:CerR family C-terminal domain-containing protein [Pseudoduganella namucuonensis]SFU37302.1 transcriptional regulator, TetR family [Pseudoduganella namucuonensis]